MIIDYKMTVQCFVVGYYDLTATNHGLCSTLNSDWLLLLGRHHLTSLTCGTQLS